MPKEDQINTKSSGAPEKSDEAKKKDETPKDDKGVPLTEQDIRLFKRYGKSPYNDSLKKVEDEIKGLNQKITELIGIKESDTGLALPAQWNLAQDK
jgi:26S proteasome regulatory subunit T1